MTNEEAIIQLEIEATNIIGALASEPQETFLYGLLLKKIDALDMAISALRAKTPKQPPKPKICPCFHKGTRMRYLYNRYTGRPEELRQLPIGVCYGTKEREECHCMGDRSKCNFYPEVREKAQKDSECEYCKDTSQKPFDVIFIGKFGEYNYDLCVEDFNIKFCPMCGRDLKNEG